MFHGNKGYSRKGSDPASAGCYYSLTRFRVEGRLVSVGKEVDVCGCAWMDHEFSSAPLLADLKGWDWFGLQLSARTELMIYLLRKENGGNSEASSGSFVDRSGTVVRLCLDEILVDVEDSWLSPHSETRYPARWRIHIPKLGLVLMARRNLADQEMRTPESTRITYWEDCGKPFKL